MTIENGVLAEGGHSGYCERLCASEKSDIRFGEGAVRSQAGLRPFSPEITR
jgi:hypothetical protein